MSVLAIDPMLLFGNDKNADPVKSSEAKADQKFKEMLAADEDAKKELAEITKGGAKGYWGGKSRNCASRSKPKS